MHVVVTGGSSGIGAAIAMEYAGRGACLSLIARRAALLEETARRLVAANPDARVQFRDADVRDEAGLTAAIRSCEADFGPCDRLVASAGIVLPAPFAAQSAEDFNGQVETNFKGTVHAVRAVFAGMSARHTGRIIIIGSGAGLVGIYGYSAYCASKFALAGFAEALRQEARPNGVGVSICFPPDTQTSQFEAELLNRPAEAAAIIGSGGTASARRVARLTIAAVERGRFAIYPGIRMNLLGYFRSLVAPVLRQIFDRHVDAVQRSAANAPDGRETDNVI